MRLVTGSHPDPAQLPVGCRFQMRCPQVIDRCRQDAPDLVEVTPGRWAACHLVEPMPPRAQPTAPTPARSAT